MSRDQYDPMLHIAESLESIAVSLEKIANPMITLTPPTLPALDAQTEHRPTLLTCQHGNPRYPRGHNDRCPECQATDPGPEDVVCEACRIRPPHHALSCPHNKPGRVHITSYTPGRCETTVDNWWVSVPCNRHKGSPPRTEFPVET